MLDGVRRLADEALEERGVLAVHGQHGRLVRLHEVAHERARHDERLLVGEGDRLACADRRERRAQPGEPDDGRDHDLHGARRRRRRHPLRPDHHLHAEAAERGTQGSGFRLVPDHDELRPERAGLLGEERGVAVRGEGDDAEPVREEPDDLERLRPDRARRAEDGEAGGAVAVDADGTVEAREHGRGGGRAYHEDERPARPYNNAGTYAFSLRPTTPRAMLVRLFIATLAVGLAAPALAQRPALQRPPQETADPATAKFRLADAYLRAGQTERAVALLEDLRADDPASFAVYDKLKEAHVASKDYAAALALVADRIERAGASPNVLAERGRLHALAGDPEAAAAAWREAVEAAPHDPAAYRLVHSAQADARRYDDAIATLRLGRERLDPSLFRVELGELYGRTNAYDEAITEYAALLADDPQRLAFVQSRLGPMLERDGAPGAFAGAVERLIRREPLVLTHRELAAWLYAETGDFAAALDAVRALDRLRGEEGQALFAFAESALAAEAFDEALRALEIVLDRHADGPVAPLALLSTGLLHEMRAERSGERAFDGAGSRLPTPGYDAARAHYDDFLSRYPTHRNRPVALGRLAGLQKDVFREYDRAEALLRELLERFPTGEAAARAHLALGDVALMRGDLAAARAAYTHVEETERIGETAELARLELARLAFYEGNFETARTRAQAMNRNTATDVANDAIALKLLLAENAGPDSTSAALRAYARAELLQRRQQPGRALAAVDSLLAAFPEHALTDEATFLRAGLLRDLGRADEAVAVLGAFPERFPDSHLADRSVFVAAEIHERDLSDFALAITGYTALLTRYPGSLLAPEARARIRRLRGDAL